MGWKDSLGSFGSDAIGSAVVDQGQRSSGKDLVDVVHNAYLASRSRHPIHPAIQQLNEDVARITARAKPPHRATSPPLQGSPTRQHRRHHGKGGHHKRHAGHSKHRPASHKPRPASPQRQPAALDHVATSGQPQTAANRSASAPASSRSGSAASSQPQPTSRPQDTDAVDGKAAAATAAASHPQLNPDTQEIAAGTAKAIAQLRPTAARSAGMDEALQWGARLDDLRSKCNRVHSDQQACEQLAKEMEQASGHFANLVGSSKAAAQNARKMAAQRAAAHASAMKVFQKLAPKHTTPAPQVAAAAAAVATARPRTKTAGFSSDASDQDAMAASGVVAFMQIGERPVHRRMVEFSEFL